MDPTIKEQIANKKLAFEHQAPAVKTIIKDYNIEKENNRFIGYDSSHQKLVECVILPSPCVLKHIAFLTIQLTTNDSLELILACLRDIALQLQKEGFKKIEVFSHEPKVIASLKQLGYYYRGEKTASLKLNGIYYNEIGTDFSFFDIDDALSLLNTLELDALEYKPITEHLQTCRTIIRNLSITDEIDDYFAIYCENLAFQMVRELLGEYPIYQPDEFQWKTLVDGLPVNELHPSFYLLLNTLVLNRAEDVTATHTTKNTFR